MRVRPLFCRVLGLVGLIVVAPVIGLSAPSGASTLVVTATGGIHPLTASTCSGNVCIYVVGTGLNVSDWSTTASLSKSMCSAAKFIEDGTVIATGATTCGSAGGGLDADWPSPGNFPNGTILCNTWSGIAGEPCITVHS